MLVTILLALVIVLALAAGLWIGLAYAMRRPGLARRLLRIRPLRRVMGRMAAMGMRSARKKAARDGRIRAGRQVSDLEVALAAADTEQARQAKAMLARMSPRQRAEFSRRTMGADGLSGLLADAAALDAGDGTEMLGRADRRRGAGLAGSPGQDAARAAQRRKAVAKRRAARKGARR
jgi:hypothetical protein